MEDTKRGDSCPKLLDLMVPKERDWMMRESEGGGKTSFGVQQEKNLELKLKLVHQDLKNLQLFLWESMKALLEMRRNAKEKELDALLAGDNDSCSCFIEVKDVMKKDEELPICKERDLIIDQLVELTSKGCGCLLVVDDENHLIGTFTDDDL